MNINVGTLPPDSEERYIATEDHILQRAAENMPITPEVEESSFKLSIVTNFALLIHFFIAESIDFVALYFMLVEEAKTWKVAIIVLGLKWLLHYVLVRFSRIEIRHRILKKALVGWVVQSMLYLSIGFLSFFDLGMNKLVIPLTVVLVGTFYTDCNCGADGETEILLKFLSTCNNLLLYCQHLTIAFRVAGKINWGYRQVFWSYWIIIVLLVGFAIMILFVFVWTCVFFVIKWMHNAVLLPIVKHLIFLGVLSAVFILAVYLFGNFLVVLAPFLDNPELGAGKLTRWTLFVLAHNLVFALLLAVFNNHIIHFVVSVFAFMEDLDDSQMEQNPDLPSENRMVRKLRKKIRVEDLPSFVHKFTSTYFKAIPKSERSAYEGNKPQPKKAVVQKGSLSICPAKPTVEHYTKPKQDALSFSYRRSADRSINLSQLPARDKLNESAFLCNVCFEIESDVVFMECGHGGLCFRCAEDIWKASGECYLCRQNIEYILRYDNKNKKEDQFKVVEMYQESSSQDVSKAYLS